MHDGSNKEGIRSDLAIELGTNADSYKVIFKSQWNVADMSFTNSAQKRTILARVMSITSIQLVILKIGSVANVITMQAC